jgi:6-phosphogluconolactonase (cycloisomerase 2 family)
LYQKFLRVFVAVFATAMMLTLFALSGTSASAAPNLDHAVFTTTNAAAGNAVVAYARADNGSLSPAGTFATGGNGFGSGLGSQGAVALKDGHRLYTVNAGSNTISIFEVKSNELELRGQVASGGVKPISLTVHDDWLYVLNVGGTPNISGFKIDDGKLKPIAGSTQPLSAGAVSPEQVSFNPKGDVLIVTEKGSNNIDTYTVNDHGVASGPHGIASHGAGPYGFAFDNHGHAIVSEAAAQALSSYSVAPNGALSVISGSVLDGGQAAPCWVATTKNGRYAYTANAGSGTISAFGVAQNGALTLINYVSAGPHPLDMTISENDKYLYVLNSTPSIGVFQIQANGSLVHLSDASESVAGTGLAAR